MAIGSMSRQPMKTSYLSSFRSNDRFGFKKDMPTFSPNSFTFPTKLSIHLTRRIPLPSYQNGDNIEKIVIFGG